MGAGRAAAVWPRERLGRQPLCHRASAGAVARTGGEVAAMQERREQLADRLRKAEQARDLLRELERRLKDRDGTQAEDQPTQLERLAQTLPEADRIRWLIESAAGSARADRSAKAGSDVSRSRSAIEGEISTLRGTLERGVT